MKPRKVSKTLRAYVAMKTSMDKGAVREIDGSASHIEDAENR
ncbi:MAG: hypothetical protein P8Y80_10710 [Acidobacteriota bacterium]|jgi:hypothetical protein